MTLHPENIKVFNVRLIPHGDPPIGYTVEASISELALRFECHPFSQYIKIENAVALKLQSRNWMEELLKKEWRYWNPLRCNVCQDVGEICVFFNDYSIHIHHCKWCHELFLSELGDNRNTGSYIKWFPNAQKRALELRQPISFSSL